MRVLVVTFFLCSLMPVLASAKSSPACLDVALDDAAAIKACLEDDVWYKARTKPLFQVHRKCSMLQLQIAKKTMAATDLKGAKRLNIKSIEHGLVPLASCQTASDVVELIRNRPSSWYSCLGYEEAKDKYAHFETCLVGYTMGRYQIADVKQARARLSGMNCQHAEAEYKKALSLIYSPLREEGPRYGRRLPLSYSPVDCIQVNAFLEQTKKEAEEKRAQQIAQAKASRAAMKRIAEEKERKRAVRAKNTADFYRKMEEAEQRSFQKMDEQILNRLKARVDPKDTFENKHLHLALVKQVWAQKPQEENQMGSFKGKLLHTTHGFKTWTNMQLAPNVFHAIKNAKLKNCDVRKGRARCEYDVTVSSWVAYKDHRNQARADFYSQFASSFTGPRTYRWSNDFIHDGQQWNVKLTAKQKKLILPPEVDFSDRRSENEKRQCDLMSAMGIPMLCG